MPDEEKVHEIRIVSVESLSESGKGEVKARLMCNPMKNYQGFAAISYAEKPYRILHVKPIEGTSLTYLKQLKDNLHRANERTRLLDEVEKILEDEIRTNEEWINVEEDKEILFGLRQTQAQLGLILQKLKALRENGGEKKDEVI